MTRVSKLTGRSEGKARNSTEERMVNSVWIEQGRVLDDGIAGEA